MLYTNHALDSQFRQSMEQPLTPEGEAAARSKLHALMDALLTHRDLNSNIHLQTMLLACRLRLRVLQNVLLAARCQEDFQPLRCEIRAFTADLCAAADLLLSPLGRSVHFSAAERPMECLCMPRDYAWLVLELICNCAQHCHGEEIRLALQPHGKACCVLTVQCEGVLDMDALHTASMRSGSGTAAMQRTAWLHKGALLWLSRGDTAVAALRLAGCRHSRKTPASTLPDYVELLSDPCSQVYIALAPAIGTIV